MFYLIFHFRVNVRPKRITSDFYLWQSHVIIRKKLSNYGSVWPALIIVLLKMRLLFCQLIQATRKGLKTLDLGSQRRRLFLIILNVIILYFLHFTINQILIMIRNLIANNSKDLPQMDNMDI